MKDIAPPTCISILAAVTARQEQLEFYLRCAASIVAIIAGCLAIYRFFRPREKRDITLD